MVHWLFEPVFMYENLFDRHVKKIGYIHCKFEGWSASSVFDRTDRLPRYPKLFHQIILPYLLFFSDLCEIVLHKFPQRTLVQLYRPILPLNHYVSSILYVNDNNARKNLPLPRQVFVVLRPGIEPGTRGFSVPCSTY